MCKGPLCVIFLIVYSRVIFKNGISEKEGRKGENKKKKECISELARF